MTRIVLKLITHVWLISTIILMLVLGIGRTLHEDEILFWGKLGNKDFDIYRIAVNRHLTMPIAQDFTPDTSLTNAVWSPDGQQIAFVSQHVSQQHLQGSIFITDAEGHNRKLLIANLDCVFNLTWSPDGQQIAAISGCYPSSVLMTIDLKQSRTSYLTNNVSDGYAPHWSSDGQQISFRYLENNRNASDIYTINIDTGSIGRLAAKLPSGLSPSVSPDGHYVVFAKTLSGSSQSLYGIYLYDLANQRTIALYENEKYITSSINWSSDSQFIVYAAGSLGDSDLLTLDIATCLEQSTSCIPKQVSLSKGQYIDPHWRPHQP